MAFFIAMFNNENRFFLVLFLKSKPDIWMLKQNNILSFLYVIIFFKPTCSCIFASAHNQQQFNNLHYTKNNV